MSRSWDPTVADVGALLRARTFDANGNEAGTFNTTTRPTAVQVTALIAQASGEVYGVLGDVPEVMWDTARGVISTLTAMKVELGYFPEQVATGRSPYDQLAKQYESMLTRAEKAVARIEAGETTGELAEGPLPIYQGPADAGGLVGWGTRW